MAQPCTVHLIYASHQHRLSFCHTYSRVFKYITPASQKGRRVSLQAIGLGALAALVALWKAWKSSLPRLSICKLCLCKDEGGGASSCYPRAPIRTPMSLG